MTAPAAATTDVDQQGPLTYLTLIGLGVGVVLALGFVAGRAANVLSGAVVIAFGLVALVGLVGVRSRGEEPATAWIGARRPRLRADLALAVLVSLGVQSWFIRGGSPSVGDIYPPEGTAWVSRVFTSWTWTGGDLGSVNALSPYAPWAAVLGLVHALGGSERLALDVWLSALVAVAALGMARLARTLGARPLVSAIAGLLYVFNPYTVSLVGFNAVFWCAVLILPWMANTVLRVGRELTVVEALGRTLILVPLLGFAYLNPPLLLMVVLVFLLSAALAFAQAGRGGRGPLGRYVLASGVAVALASAYFMLPSLLRLGAVATERLTSLDSWAFTESRASVTNALWLNTTWAWDGHDYFPFSDNYARFPLSLIRFILPALAFSSLLFVRRKAVTALQRRVVYGGVVLSVLLILFSNGTKSPGRLIFLPIYRLPGGWLFREPGRFLMVVTFCFALLIAFGAEWWLRGARHAWRGTAALLAVVPVVLAVSYPLLTGAIAPGAHDGFPTTHVTTPGYWQSMLHELNQDADQSSVLMLPVNDFYQLPYRWYYGTDSFIYNGSERRIIDPVPEGYFTGTAGLADQVVAFSDALLAGDARTADRLLDSVGVGTVVVRGDLDFNFRGRSLVDPQRLLVALKKDRYMRESHRQGPLVSFERRQHVVTAGIAPVVTADQDVSPRVKGLLPASMHVARSTPRVGISRLVQLAPLDTWRAVGDRVETEVQLGPGESASVGRTDETPIADAVPAGSRPARVGAHLSVQAVGANRHTLQVELSLGHDLRAGAPGRPRPQTQAECLPGNVGTSSSRGVCLDVPLSWKQGLARAEVTPVASANGARACILESPGNVCTPLIKVSGSGGTLAKVVNPVAGTTSLSLRAWAADSAGRRSPVASYRANLVPSLPDAYAIVTPPRSVHQQLLLSDQGCSTAWTADAGRRVCVDGLRNGWLFEGAPPTPSYSKSWLIQGSYLLSALVYLTVGLAWLLVVVRKRRASA